MKAKGLFIGLLIAASFTITSTINLNAAVTIEKIWDPGTRLLVPNARVPFIQLFFTSDTAEPIQYIKLDRLGNADFRKVFDRVVGIDGFSKVIAVAGAENSGLYDGTVYLRFSRLILLPKEPMLLTIAGETLPGVLLGAETGKTIGIKVSELMVGNIGDPNVGSTPVNITGATHTVNGSLKIGEITGIKKVNENQNSTVGDDRLLGVFRFEVSSVEDIRCLPTFTVHSNGKSGHIYNLQFVFMDGSTFELVQKGLSSDGRKATFEIGSDVTFPKGGVTAYVKGTIGDSFAPKDVFALSTTPSEWRSCYGQLYGYEIPMRGLGTIVAETHTIKGPRLDVRIVAPEHQSVLPGSTAITVLTYILDATESAEDIYLGALPYEFGTLSVEWKSHITKLRFVDASSGTIISPEVSPASYEDRGALFIRENLALNYPDGIVIQKGTRKIVEMRVDFSPQAVGFYAFGLTESWKYATGVESGKNVTPTVTSGWSIFQIIRGEKG